MNRKAISTRQFDDLHSIDGQIGQSLLREIDFQENYENGEINKYEYFVEKLFQEVNNPHQVQVLSFSSKIQIKLVTDNIFYYEKKSMGMTAKNSKNILSL